VTCIASSADLSNFVLDARRERHYNMLYDAVREIPSYALKESENGTEAVGPYTELSLEVPGHLLRSSLLASLLSILLAIRNTMLL
jgi:hypothetical protein